MQATKIIGLIIASLFVIWVIAFISANRFATAPVFQTVKFSGTPSAGVLPSEEFAITSWNVGYAGMGKEADFVMDGGQQSRPESADLVRRNGDAIGKYLADHPADIYILQETAAPSSNNYRYDLNSKIESVLDGYQHIYDADAQTRLLPPPVNLSIGNSIFTKHDVSRGELRRLPLEPTFVYGLFRKSYAMQIVRMTDYAENVWVIVNIHLSAFDSVENNVREKQLQAVISFAEAEFARGAHVIVGGDWNLRLSPDTVPHTTPDEFLFWIRDLPAGVTPHGWGWAVDPSRPTVRTAHKPYVAGENATLIIDGFLYSPNVQPLAVSTADLEFANTDHHPVTMRLRAR